MKLANKGTDLNHRFRYTEARESALAHPVGCAVPCTHQPRSASRSTQQSGHQAPARVHCALVAATSVKSPHQVRAGRGRARTARRDEKRKIRLKRTVGG